MGKVLPVGNLHTPYVHQAKSSQGFPSSSALTCAKGMVCLILGPTQGRRAGGKEKVGVLGSAGAVRGPLLDSSFPGPLPHPSEQERQSPI